MSVQGFELQGHQMMLVLGSPLFFHLPFAHLIFPALNGLLGLLDKAPMTCIGPVLR